MLLEKNKIIIVSGASGAGKTTLVNHLLNCPSLNLAFSISACTRPKRSMEKHRKNYKFFSQKEFKNKINSDDFLEWEEVYPGSFYGTLKADTLKLLNSGKNILFDVDVYGAKKIKQYFLDQALGIFIQAPSLEITKERLMSRKTESPATLKMRLHKITHEIEIGKTMDMQLINNELDKSKKEIYDLVFKFLMS